MERTDACGEKGVGGGAATATTAATAHRSSSNDNGSGPYNISSGNTRYDSNRSYNSNANHTSSGGRGQECGYRRERCWDGGNKDRSQRGDCREGDRARRRYDAPSFSSLSSRCYVKSTPTAATAVMAAAVPSDVVEVRTLRSASRTGLRRARGVTTTMQAITTGTIRGIRRTAAMTGPTADATTTTTTTTTGTTAAAISANSAAIAATLVVAARTETTTAAMTYLSVARV